MKLETIRGKAADGLKKLFRFKRIYSDSGEFSGWIRGRDISVFYVSKGSGKNWNVWISDITGKRHRINRFPFDSHQAALAAANASAGNMAERARLTYYIGLVSGLLGILGAVIALVT